jgi:hypothetical protein
MHDAAGGQDDNDWIHWESISLGRVRQIKDQGEDEKNHSVRGRVWVVGAMRVKDAEQAQQ